MLISLPRLLWFGPLLFAACGATEPQRKVQDTQRGPQSKTEREQQPDQPEQAATVLMGPKVGVEQAPLFVDAGNLTAEQLQELLGEVDGSLSLNPIEYLDRLARGNSAPTAPDGVRDWLRVEHVPELMKRLDSTRPVAHVVATKSSILPMEGTTEGFLAMYFLHCLNVGQFPAGLGSHMDSFWSEPEAWHEWWQLVQRLETLSLPAERGKSPWRGLTACDLIDRAGAFAGGAVLVPSLPPYKWVSDQQVPDLMARIRSKRPTATLIFPGFVPAEIPGPSTEGETAMMMLHLYAETLRNHHARLTTTTDTEIDRDPKVWDQWFKNWQSTRR